jgi:uncharacterized protein (TIGR02186 family)
MRRVLLILALLAAAPAFASEKLVTGVSRDDVQITADFTGSDILVYGAVLRDSPRPKGQSLDVIVTLEGPATQVVVRRKERWLGIWVNRNSVHLNDVPSYFSIAATRPLPEILTPEDDAQYNVSLDRRILVTRMSAHAMDFPLYIQALKRIRAESGVFKITPDAVRLSQDTLFRADFALPANVTEGDFRVRLFLLRDGRVIDTTEQIIGVRKAGIERQLANLAQEKPFIYGVLSLIMALVAGWGASAVFRLFQR